jgi:hypothetical protein
MFGRLLDLVRWSTPGRSEEHCRGPGGAGWLTQNRAARVTPPRRRERSSIMRGPGMEVSPNDRHNGGCSVCSCPCCISALANNRGPAAASRRCAGGHEQHPVQVRLAGFCGRRDTCAGPASPSQPVGAGRSVPFGATRPAHELAQQPARAGWARRGGVGGSKFWDPARLRPCAPPRTNPGDIREGGVSWEALNLPARKEKPKPAC